MNKWNQSSNLRATHLSFAFVTMLSLSLFGCLDEKKSSTLIKSDTKPTAATNTKPVKTTTDKDEPIAIFKKTETTQAKENVVYKLAKPATRDQVIAANNLVTEISKAEQVIEKKMSDKYVISNLQELQFYSNKIKSEITKPNLSIIELRLALNQYYQLCLGKKSFLDTLKLDPKFEIEATALYIKISRVFEYLYALEYAEDYNDMKNEVTKGTIQNQSREVDRGDLKTKSKSFRLQNIGQAIESIDNDVIPRLNQCPDAKLPEKDLKSLQEMTTDARRRWSNLKNSEIKDYQLRIKKIVSLLIKIDHKTLEEMMKQPNCVALATVIRDFIATFNVSYASFIEIDDKAAAENLKLQKAK